MKGFKRCAVTIAVVLILLFTAGCTKGNGIILPDNDFHTALQYAYINDENVENIENYAKGKKELGRPRAIELKFDDERVLPYDHFVGYSSDEDFSSETVVRVKSKKNACVYNLEKGRTVYYRRAKTVEKLSLAKTQSITIASDGPRNLFIDGVSNVRDIGGYDSYLVEGGKIRQGLLLRGGNLNSITESGKAELLRLGIKQEIDLRDEQYCLGGFSPEVEYYAVPIPSGTEETRFEEFADEYTQIFTLISAAAESPVYLHCSAGADRTGICVFMLLTLCGADEKDVARDYLFTNFSVYGSRLKNFSTEFTKWREKLDAFEGKRAADKAKSWLVSKGLSENEIEKIRETFVEGYTSELIDEKR